MGPSHEIGIPWLGGFGSDPEPAQRDVVENPELIVGNGVACALDDGGSVGQARPGDLEAEAAVAVLELVELDAVVVRPLHGLEPQLARVRVDAGHLDDSRAFRDAVALDVEAFAAHLVEQLDPWAELHADLPDLVRGLAA